MSSRRVEVVSWIEMHSGGSNSRVVVLLVEKSGDQGVLEDSASRVVVLPTNVFAKARRPPSSRRVEVG